MIEVTNNTQKPAKLDNTAGSASVTIAVGETRQISDTFMASALKNKLRILSPGESSTKTPEKAEVVEKSEATQDERLPVVVAAIEQIFKTGDVALLTANKQPRASAIEEIVGFNVDATLRTAAMAAYDQQRAGE